MITATVAIIINREVALKASVEALDFGVPTTIGAPVKTDAGTMQDTVLGGVKVVATRIQLFPSQYSMTLLLSKLGLEMLTAPEMSELKDSPFDVTLIWQKAMASNGMVPVSSGWFSP